MRNLTKAIGSIFTMFLSGIAALAQPVLVEQHEFGIAVICISEPRPVCLDGVREILGGLANEPDATIHDNAIRQLVESLVGVLDERLSDEKYMTVSLALLEIAGFARSSELGGAIVEIAGIIGRRDLLVISPAVLLASAN